ncbi:metal cation transporter, ZIP family [Ancylostoma ceylanicum]|uniref:Metal cation transporter, ZIP family n=1 Tax=Ancylostoma ceylanicum TaxID=53326 RepID=A0A0D6LSU1_9BILA|nr:metal cation transporter, ZIP family [Ancylostoma ceylanicum]
MSPFLLKIPSLTWFAGNGTDAVSRVQKRQENHPGMICSENRANYRLLYKAGAEEELRREAAEISRLLNPPKVEVPYSTWLWSLFGCSLVVLSGILPALILPANSSEYLQTQGKFLNKCRFFLSPEAYAVFVQKEKQSESVAFVRIDIDRIGFCTLGGLLVCSFIEKLCSTTEESQHRICAIMNLCANLVDNFTHGLAVGASFLISPKFGLMTTFAILVHEIPHEVSDFAILLRADFNKIDAVKAQLVTASGGVLGAVVALYLRSGAVQSADWILPFTAGGFINIALAQILPELNRETNRKQNLRQLAMIVLGLGVMAAVNRFHVA